MGWLRSLLRWADAPTAQHNDTVVSFTHDLTTPVDPIDRIIRGHTTHLSSAPVNRDQALSVPAVLRGRNLLCSIATLPLVTRDRDRAEARSALLEQIDPDVPNVVTLAQTVEDLIFEGISWWQITDRYADGWPRTAMHLDVGTVSMQPPAGSWRQLRTLPSGQHLPGGVVWVNGQPVPGRDVVRFDSPNPGVLVAAARAIRRAILLEKAAALYANDPRPLDYFTPVDNADPAADEEVQDILTAWAEARRERSTAYVPAALKYNTVDTPSPAELQLVQLQQQATVEIANAMGLDAEDLQVSTTSRTYANAVDRRRDRINDVLAPYMRAITDRLSMNDITRRGYRVEFDLDDYMRANPTERWSTYQTGLATQVLSVAEVREMEGLPAVPIEPVRPQPRPQPRQPEQEAGMSRRTHFSSDGTERIAFEIPEADAEFRVNRDKRTISGLLIPWNTIARNGFAKWRFAKDSLTWTQESRVKLNREHDRREAVGVATRLQSTPKGLDGSFRIARGPEGDQVLSLAEDGVLDGFSIEAEFDDDSYELSRDNTDDLVRDVKTARLVGVAITASPAFDDARVSRVAASRKEMSMADTPDAPQRTEGTPAAGPDKQTTEAFTSAVEAFTSTAGGFTEAIKQLVEVQQNKTDGPEVVDPTRRKAQFAVNEEPMYRFDGSRGKHDFSSDIIAMSKKDHEAEARVIEWIKDSFGPIAKFVSTGDVSTLNPVRQRPDLYVDQLQFPTPLWDSINKGTLDDNTPFVLPKFASAANLVNDHTEGTEPTAGSFTTTSQTITPSAVSGKVEITREAWDQGGNPQLSVILWRQIVREYFEALEQASATMLDGLTVPEITLTANGADDVVTTELKKALADLHFVRGGFRYRDFKLAQDLYTKLAAAKDADGRPLFPVLGAQNADGTTGALFGSLAIAGLAGTPAWALPQTVFGTPNTPSKSYLFNREDVHGWASAPQRLDFEYRVAYVDIGVWGYKALACTRTDGVRRINYDDGRTA
ncbi:phage portal protein [Saccharomonospora cyanea]|uniref:Phage head maturation protease n=1 Tax=Saccharomonospora cyanea NA-134 TaxID=882082 RepID=H5XG55_9PSEU|nr:phage portal protein [Saccharomonospora cyanea]EHR62637.1 phage head maturation protease [Saccharomonospora cyanea NA-134]